MGMSHGKPQGRGMGPEDTNAIFKELLRSRAIHSEIMGDIEDFRIFVPNVDRDKVSDMTANIIKLQLLEYTKQQCELHNIPLLQTVPSGMYQDAKHKRWDNQYTERLVINNKPILLVPKRIVSFTDKYTTQEQFDKEIEKGMSDVKAGRVYSADAIEAEMKRDFGI